MLYTGYPLFKYNPKYKFIKLKPPFIHYSYYSLFMIGNLAKIYKNQIIFSKSLFLNCSRQIIKY